jgi:hypothetical protein
MKQQDMPVKDASIDRCESGTYAACALDMRHSRLGKQDYLSERDGFTCF